MTTEYVVRVDGHPVYSGDLDTALAHRARAVLDGRSVKIVQRVVSIGEENVNSETGEVTKLPDSVREIPYRGK